MKSIGSKSNSSLHNMAIKLDCARIEEEKIGRVTIYKTKKSPHWYLQWNENGKQYRPSLGTSSKKRATNIAREKDAELTLGIYSGPKRKAVTIQEIIEKYLESQKTHVSADTSMIYRRDLAQFQAFSDESGVRRLDKASADHLEAFEDHLRTKGAPKIRQTLNKRKSGYKKVRGGPNLPRTIRGKMKTIRQTIKWAVKRGMVLQDPSPGYRLPRPVKTKPVPFSALELKTILEAAPPPFEDIFNFFRLTGLRNNELCWLTREDVDPQFRFIHIREKTCPFTGTTWHPKHGNDRIVPLSSEAAEIVRRHHQPSPNPWLFFSLDTPGKAKGKFTISRIWKALKAILKAKEIHHGTVHTFRHCYCSFLANQQPPISPFLVMKYMGHSSLDIVMTYYHAATEDLLGGIQGVDFSRMLSTENVNENSKVSVN